MSNNALAMSAKGTFYHLVVSGITLGLGFVRSVLLMRLLGPEEFGIISLALFFATFITPLLSIGIDSALIQEKTPSEDAFSTHFTLRLLLWCFIFLICLAVSPVLANAYGTAVVLAFIALVGVHLFEATYATQNVILRREMRFGSLAVLNLLSSLAMTIIAPLSAYLGAGFWSLVIEQAVGPIVRWGCIHLIIRPWKLSVKLVKPEAKKQLRFGSHVMATHFLGIILDRFDDFWLGTVMGKSVLGFYSRAYEIAQYPERILATPVTNVFLSTYAALQDRPIDRTKAFFRSSSFLIRAGFLMTVCLLAVTNEFTIIFFTESWLPIVPVFRLMLVYILLDPLYTNLSYLITGMGRPDLLLKTRLWQTGIFAVTVPLLGNLWQANGVALAADLMMLTGVVLLLRQSRYFVQFSMRRLAGWPTLALVLSVATGILPEWSVWFVTPWSSLVVKCLACGTVYLGTLYLFERQEIQMVSNWLINIIFEILRQSRSSILQRNATQPLHHKRTTPLHKEDSSAQPIRVMHIISDIGGGGAERLLVNSLEWFDKVNYNHQVCCIRRGGVYEEIIRRNNIPLTILPNRHRFDPSIITKLTHLLKKEKIDVVHTYNFTANTWGRLSAWLAKVPVIIASEHGTAWTETSRMRHVSRIMYYLGDLIVANSETSKIILTNKIGLPASKIHIINNGIPPIDSLSTSNTIRQLLNIPFKSPLVGVVGRMDTAKGHHVFLKAIPFIVNELPETHFVIIGEGPLRSWLEQLIESLGLLSTDHIHLPGFILDAGTLIGEFDVLVHPSIRDSYPLALIEAAWMSVPVVATNVDGIAEIVIHGKTGLLVECTQPLSDIPTQGATPLPDFVVDGNTHKLRPPMEADPRVLSEAIISLLKNPPLMKKMGQFARERAEEQFHIKRYVSNFEEIYRMVQR